MARTVSTDGASPDGSALGLSAGETLAARDARAALAGSTPPCPLLDLPSLVASSMLLQECRGHLGLADHPLLAVLHLLDLGELLADGLHPFVDRLAAGRRHRLALLVQQERRHQADHDHPEQRQAQDVGPLLPPPLQVVLRQEVDPTVVDHVPPLLL
jgi:hypothetical protein